MDVALLLVMLTELSFSTGAGSSTFLIPQARKITFLCGTPYLSCALCSCSLLHGKGKQSISISLLAPLLVAEVSVNHCHILCLCSIWLFFFFFNWALYLWNVMPRFPSLPSLHRVWFWNTHFHYGETICCVWGISSTRHNVSLYYLEMCPNSAIWSGIIRFKCLFSTQISRKAIFISPCIALHYAVLNFISGFVCWCHTGPAVVIISDTCVFNNSVLRIRYSWIYMSWTMNML